MQSYGKEYCDEYRKIKWTSQDSRLNQDKFSTLSKEWNNSTPVRTDYERRQALVEIDVLVAMSLNMTLNQLNTIYRIQFPVLQQYDNDTWYDSLGRIVLLIIEVCQELGLIERMGE